MIFLKTIVWNGGWNGTILAGVYCSNRRLKRWFGHCSTQPLLEMAVGCYSAPITIVNDVSGIFLTYNRFFIFEKS
jgi:hypothetical protein